MFIYIACIYVYHHYDDVMLLSWISLTFSCHPSLGLLDYILYWYRAVVYRF